MAIYFPHALGRFPTGKVLAMFFRGGFSLGGLFHPIKPKIGLLGCSRPQSTFTWSCERGREKWEKLVIWRWKIWNEKKRGASLVTGAGTLSSVHLPLAASPLLPLILQHTLIYHHSSHLKVFGLYILHRYKWPFAPARGPDPLSSKKFSKKRLNFLKTMTHFWLFLVEFCWTHFPSGQGLHLTPGINFCIHHCRLRVVSLFLFFFVFFLGFSCCVCWVLFPVSRGRARTAKK